tara:strand:- start:123 stop:467 length:345 start_codon:yes stop_codon:yes gene_type:complete
MSILNKSLDERLSESAKIKKKYPDKIPVIIKKSSIDKNLKEIDREKYLIPFTLLISQLHYIVRKKININAEQAIYLFCNNKLISTSETIGNIYNKNKNEDGFLYIEYTAENTFG